LKSTKQTAVIFDLDGTLADLNGRKPFGKDIDVLEDKCIDCIAELSRLYAYYSPHHVLIVSGRSDAHASDTITWLARNNIARDQTFMREEGDYRPDTELKEEIYRERIEPYYDVILVFEDRPKVIKMWRDIGLKVADVGNGVDF
jgi:hypothetical protein